MQIDRARYLVSPEGKRALASLPASHAALSPTALATALRKSFAPVEAAALAEQLTLRAKAAGRLGDGRAHWLLTADGSEMMTLPSVAARRAKRLAESGAPLADLTCGLGGDLAALAAEPLGAIGLEQDPATGLLAAHNVPEGRILRGDATAPPIDPSRFTLVIDPSRRDGAGGRTFKPELFSPPFDLALDLARRALTGVVKGPPGLDRANVPDEAEFEAVQAGRTLRETATWFGEGTTPGLRRAVLLPAGVELDSNAEECDPGVVAIGQVLYDPQSCVTRAHLVRQLGQILGAHMIDSQIAYLTGDTAVTHPMAEAFEVLDVLPFSVERLRKRLREGGWRPFEFRRRAFPVDPNELEKLLGKFTGEPVVVLCTTLAGKRTVAIGRSLGSR